MRAISLWQPWASLVAIGAKKIETRSWDPRWTGPIAIHAAKGLNLQQRIALQSYTIGQTLHVARICLDQAGRPDNSLPRGCIIAVCTLGRITSILGGNGVGILGSGETIDGEEYEFGDYSAGRFAWMLSDVRKLEKPIPWKGRQKWFEVPDELISAQLAAGEINAELLPATKAGELSAAREGAGK
jgi:activating signal cointegrator 1